jgi:hypothetical protein
VLRGYVRKGGKPIGEFKTDAKAQDCVQELRRGLKGYKLRSYGGSGRLIVMTDASGYGVGGAIVEITEEVDETVGLMTVLKSDQLAGVFSRSLNESEARWSVFEKEMFAIIQACEHFFLEHTPSGFRFI